MSEDSRTDEPVSAVTVDVGVAHHVFDIEDVDPETVDEPPPSPWLPRDYLTVRQGIVYLVTPGHTHTPVLTMQAWAHEPPPEADRAWELSQDVEFASPSGRIVVIAGMGERTDITLGLGPRETMYNLRAHSRGRERVREVEEDPDTDFDSIDVYPFWHLEEYLLQFWPARPIVGDLPAPFRQTD